MEATGHYWLNRYTKLTDYNVVVHVINPVQSDALRGLYIRKTKNDAKIAPSKSKIFLFFCKSAPISNGLSTR